MNAICFVNQFTEHTGDLNVWAGSESWIKLRAEPTALTNELGSFPVDPLGQPQNHSGR
jgi:hypothetical protein